MTIDLLLLSSRIALLVLAGSALGFAMGWLWSAWAVRKRMDALQNQLTAAQDDRLRLRQLVDAAGNEEHRPADGQQKELEQQCMDALQQRDEAERQLVEQMNRMRGLQEQMDRIRQDTVSRNDYAQLEEEVRKLRAASEQHEAAHAEELTSLRSQLDSARASVPESHLQILSAKEELLNTLQTDLHKLQEALQHSESALSKAREDAARLQAAPAQVAKAEPVTIPPAPSSAAASLPSDPVPEDDFAAFPPAPLRPVREVMRLHAPPKPGPRPNLETARALLIQLQLERSAATEPEDQAKLDRQIASMSKAIETGQAAGEDTDDLTKIKGVKTVINNQLLDHGICTWKQIMEWTSDDIASFSELLVFKNRITKDRWLEQAAALQARKEAAAPRA